MGGPVLGITRRGRAMVRQIPALTSKIRRRHEPSVLFHSNVMASAPRPVVFMDINIGETPAGRMKMELFSDIAPK